MISMFFDISRHAHYFSSAAVPIILIDIFFFIITMITLPFFSAPFSSRCLFTPYADY